MNTFVNSTKHDQDRLQETVNLEINNNKKIVIFGDEDTLDPNDVYKMFNVDDVKYSLKSKQSDYFKKKGIIDKSSKPIMETEENTADTLIVDDNILNDAPILETENQQKKINKDLKEENYDVEIKNNIHDNSEIKSIEGESGKFIGMSVETISTGQIIVTRYFTQREDLKTKEQYISHMAQCDSKSMIEEAYSQNKNIQVASSSTNGEGYNWQRIDTVYSDNQHANVQMVYYLTRKNGYGHQQEWEFTTVLNVSAYNDKDHQINYGYVLSTVDFPGQHSLGYWPDVKIGETSGSIGISASTGGDVSFSISQNFSFDDIQITKRYEPNFNECMWNYTYTRDTAASKMGSTLVQRLTFEDESNYMTMGQTNFGFEIVDTRWIGNEGNDYLSYVGPIFTCDSEMK